MHNENGEDRSIVHDQVSGVAFVCHPYHRGGVTRWMVDAAEEFANRGVPVWFVTPEPRRSFASGGGRPTMASLVRELPASGTLSLIAPVVGVPFELGTSAYRAAVYARAIRASVPPGTPCIVSDDPSVWQGAANVSGAYPMVGVLHSDDAAYYALARKHRKQLAGCVAVSRRTASRSAEIVGDLPISVIPCGIPMFPMKTSATTEREQAKLVWVGRLEEEQKRVSDLPLIAASLRDDGVDFTVTIVGNGPARCSLERSFVDRDLGAQVRFLGWQPGERIHEMLCSSDVLLLPSNYEGTPVVMMEALAAGCAVVASRVSGVEDAEGDRVTEGVLHVHAIGNIPQATTLVRGALSTPPQIRRARARIAAEYLFSIGICVDRYEEALGNLQSTADPEMSLSARCVASNAISFPIAASRSARRAVTRLTGE